MFRNDISEFPQKALNKATYGLYLLSCMEDGKDNACIIDAFMQVTNVTPAVCVITVIKQNLSHEMILNTNKFNLSVLTEGAAYDVYKRFGHQSGKDADKFDGFTGTLRRSENGLVYFADNTNAFMSFEVIDTVDFGTHTMFKAKLTDSGELSDDVSATYSYYRQHIKPKPEKNVKKHGYRCGVCDYYYEGDELPPDFICPICGLGADVFYEEQ